MSESEYLQALLKTQALADDGPEMKEIREHRAAIEALIRKAFGACRLIIRYGGSIAKRTMIRENYDEDLTVYVPSDEDRAGETLQAIRDNFEMALREDYWVEPKTSALRVRSKDGQTDLLVDVVPGRFVDGDSGDVYIYLASADKQRQKTNLEKHVAHIRDSGVRDAIRLAKLWNVRRGIAVKTFVLELLVVKLLAGKVGRPLAEQFANLLEQFRDRADTLAVEDPANPTGNDLTPLLDAARGTLSWEARATLALAEASGWEAVFGALPERSERDQRQAVRRAVASVAASRPVKPWACE